MASVPKDHVNMVKATILFFCSCFNGVLWYNIYVIYSKRCGKRMFCSAHIFHGHFYIGKFTLFVRTRNYSVVTKMTIFSHRNRMVLLCLINIYTDWNVFVLSIINVYFLFDLSSFWIALYSYVHAITKINTDLIRCLHFIVCSTLHTFHSYRLIKFIKNFLW